MLRFGLILVLCLPLSCREKDSSDSAFSGSQVTVEAQNLAENVSVSRAKPTYMSIVAGYQSHNLSHLGQMISDKIGKQPIRFKGITVPAASFQAELAAINAKGLSQAFDQSYPTLKAYFAKNGVDPADFSAAAVQEALNYAAEFAAAGGFEDLATAEKLKSKDPHRQAAFLSASLYLLALDDRQSSGLLDSASPSPGGRSAGGTLAGVGGVSFLDSALQNLLACPSQIDKVIPTLGACSTAITNTPQGTVSVQTSSAGSCKIVCRCINERCHWEGET